MPQYANAFCTDVTSSMKAKAKLKVALVYQKTAA